MRPRSAAGTSLIEALVALGLLSVVLVSISGLFVVAARRVDGGRASSQALAAAATIVEEMGCWSLRQTWELLGFDGSAPSGAASTRTSALAARWLPRLDPGLRNPEIVIRVEALGPEGAPLTLRSARAIRSRVTVSWDEGSKRRSVELVAVKT